MVILQIFAILSWADGHSGKKSMTVMLSFLLKTKQAKFGSDPVSLPNRKNRPNLVKTPTTGITKSTATSVIHP
jgi:hypothetical protein